MTIETETINPNKTEIYNSLIRIIMLLDFQLKSSGSQSLFFLMPAEKRHLLLIILFADFINFHKIETYPFMVFIDI